MSQDRQLYDGRNFEATGPALYRADQHAQRAEALLRNVWTATYFMMPVDAAVAQVHATLAQAYAEMARLDLERA